MTNKAVAVRVKTSKIELGHVGLALLAASLKVKS